VPFDAVQGFVSNEMPACKVPLIIVDDAERSLGSDSEDTVPPFSQVIGGALTAVPGLAESC